MEHDTPPGTARATTAARRLPGPLARASCPPTAEAESPSPPTLQSQSGGGPLPDANGERGQIGLFVLGACVLVLTLVVGVVDVTAVQLARVRLYDVCDSAALDAADEIAEAQVYAGGLGTAVPVSEETVLLSAARHVAGAARPERVSEWHLEPGTGTADGRSATVVLTGTVEPPLGSAIISAVTGPVTVTVRATAVGRIDGAAPSIP